VKSVSANGSWKLQLPVGAREDRDSAAMAETGKPRVVVVGGGIGGALLAKTMEPDADVVLLDP
jgi:hypothetical protein